MKYGILFLLFFYGLGKLSAQGNANAIVGVWLSENKRLKVEVYESNKKYFGKRLEIIVDETIEKGSFYLNNQKYCRENLLKNVLRVVLNEADNN